MTASVDVVIVAYRSASTIGGCLGALTPDPAVASVTVVDNAAEPAVEALVTALHETDPRFRYTAERNQGFAFAANRGAALGGAPFIALVNPDLALTKSLGCLTSLILDDLATVASGYLSTDGVMPSNTKHQVSLPRELAKSLIGTARAYRFAPPPAPQGWWYAPHADGALLVVSRADWKRLGGLDERFELYYEDVDFTLRADRRGVAVLGQEVGLHAGGASASTSRSAVWCCLQVSRVRFLRQHAGPVAGPAGALGLGALDWLVRSVSLQPEGQAARNRAMRLLVREVRGPGTVRVLTPANGQPV